MTQQNNFLNFFKNNDFAKSLEKFQPAPFDFKKILEIQRKNLQTLSEAQQLTVEGVQSIMNRQIEVISQFMEEQSFITNQLLREGTPEDKLNRNAELIKNSYDKAMANAKEISELVKKTNSKTSSLLNKRASANLKEIRDTVEKTNAA